MKNENSKTTADVNVESLYPKHIFITTGRGGGKSELCRRYFEALMEQDMPVSHEFVEYAKRDVDVTRNLYRHMLNSVYGRQGMFGYAGMRQFPEIKNVIFNPPATIVFWSDGTKTVVQCREGDEFDPEKGLAMAISKKMLGNKYDYYHVFKHWLKKNAK